MTFKEWLARFPIKFNPKGLRLDLRLYVYADGHGNLLANDDADLNQPVNDIEEAVEAFRELWNRGASAARERNQANPGGNP